MKDLPYYKHDVSEWMNGAITLETFEVQGVFINICSYYWFKSGCLTLTEIKRRLKCKDSVFATLIESRLIKIDGDDISITFLDQQLEERGNKSKINSINGSKGGAPKGNHNAKKAENSPQETTENQAKTTNIEENRGEQNKTEKKREDPLRAFVDLLDGGLKVSFLEWIQFRKEKGQKLTPSTVKKQIQFLGGRDPAVSIAIINQSITNGWTGLFELKTIQSNGSGKQNIGLTKVQQQQANNLQALKDQSDVVFGRKQ